MTQEEFLKRFAYSVSRDRIGGGGFGTVYKAYDNTLHREVAIKVSEVKTTADGKKTFSLKDEFEALSHVPRHPNIANYEEFYSFETPQGVFDYAVMQYYPDGNLSQAIKEGLTEAQKEDVAVQLLEGIDFLHRHKVVHRDLKPGNILVVKHEGCIIPLITDFGLSKAAETGDGSQFSNSFGGGTQRYSSPEQLQGKPLRFNTDLWSYGAIVYELFTGEQLFSPGSGASNSAQAELEVYNKIIHGDVTKLSKMPERWRKVAERCMVVDPEKRVKSAEELIYVLKGYEEATEVEGVAVPQGQQPQVHPQQKPQTSSQPVKPVAKPAVSKPVNNKPEPPKPETPSGGKKGKGLWIGLGVAVVVFAVVFLLKPKPKEESADTQAYQACQTVQDYRRYMKEYGTKSEHYADAKKLVDDYVADSAAKAKELIAQQQAQPSSQGGNGSANGHAYVDLGLPSGTLWATCNMGASKPEGYGSYFAWGETSTKSTYNWSTYKHANGNYNKLTKYCSKSDYGNNGFTDNLTTLQAGDDPATAQWGSGWRTPSESQWKELLDNTTRKWTTQNGKKGYLFTSKTNGQTLFLPAAGGRWDSELSDAGSYGDYWSRSLNTDNPDDAWNLDFNSGDCSMYYYRRYYGFSVRPVRQN